MPTPDSVVLTCAHLLIGGYDFSAKFNELHANPGAEMLDASTFGSGTRRKKGGVQTGNITAKGNVDLSSSGTDDMLYAEVGGSDPMLAMFDGITEGDLNAAVFALDTTSVKYNLGGSFGQLLSFDVDGQSRSMLVRSVVLDNKLASNGVAWSTDSSGSGVVAWCSSGDKMLYAGLHITALSTTLGVTISGVIAANSSSGFTVANPNGTTRITFTAQSCKAGSFAVPIPGNVLSTDQPFYRCVITLSTGTSTGASASGLSYLSIQ